MNGGPSRSSVDPYANAYGHCGDEISSTYEGRHIVVTEENLVHPDNTDPVTGDDFVRKGDPVEFMDGVGVALKTATSLTEAVPIDTEGIWRLPVTCTGEMFWEDIYVGQTLYIDWNGVISDDPTGWAIMGYALQPITHQEDGQGDPIPVTECIAVKVHWCGPWWL